jgi:hypothetical protein
LSRKKIDTDNSKNDAVENDESNVLIASVEKGALVGVHEVKEKESEESDISLDDSTEGEAESSTEFDRK